MCTSQVLSYSDKASSSTVGHDTKATLDSYQMTEFEPIYAMAENGRENARNKREQSLSVDLTSVNIRYNLTDGRVVYRSYWVDHDVFEENAKKLYAKPGFIKAMYPVFNKNSMDVEAVCANGVDIGTGYNYFESDEQRERFVSAYKEELLTLRYEELDGEELLGWLTISYRGRAERDYGLTAEGFITDEDSGYPVLRRFTKTTAVLKELGISFMDTLEPDEVRELSVWRGEGNETLELLAVEAGEPDLITDRQKRGTPRYALL